MFNKLLTATLGLAILTGMACSSVQADPENITGFGVGRLSMAGTSPGAIMWTVTRFSQACSAIDSRALALAALPTQYEYPRPGDT